MKQRTNLKKPAATPAPAGAVPSLNIIIDAKGWKAIPRLRAHIRKIAGATAAALPAKYHFPFVATVLLTGNARVRMLNRNFRGMDKATNVLSFPQFSAAELPKIGKRKGVVELGDMALALAYTKKESKEHNKLLRNHISHLVIHGLLHLFGYDHLVDDEAEAMEKLETRIMLNMGLPAPYAPERSENLRRITTRRKK